MRIWSLHPRYLDYQGLTACWRETLLAQAVLAGRTRGYRNHPQLDRFRSQTDPVAAVCLYLHGLADEADDRGYRYDRARVDRLAKPAPTIAVSTGQLALEWAWLRAKLTARNPSHLDRWTDIVQPEPHPIFHVIDGPVAPWERVTL
jgi:hypothetical protein